MAITKTDFMRGMQCPKMLWLDKHMDNILRHLLGTFADAIRAASAEAKALVAIKLKLAQ